jgi:hypothetical protein
MTMSNFLILRDERLGGKLVAACDVWTIRRSMTLSSILSSIKATAQTHGRLDSLFVLCHGFAGINIRRKVCMDAGGMGLQLGSECVLHSNVQRWTAISGTCANIVVYACAAANTEPGNEGSTADGKYLMGALAVHTKASVYAADRIQWYDPSNMDFADWEGNLWQFQPSGVPPTIVPCAPTELTTLL